MTLRTPGRWEYDADLGEIVAHHDERDDFRVAMIEDNDADGYLMAAAPDLLAACELALSDGKKYGGDITATAWQAIRAAVAKAQRLS